MARSAISKEPYVRTSVYCSTGMRLAASMAAKAEGTPPGPANRKATARGYVSFAVDNPDLLRLMFRSEMLDPTRVSLAERFFHIT